VVGNEDLNELRVPMGFYAPESLVERLRDAAREQDRSMSSVIRLALEHELQREPEPAR
jgi:predicted transcriptional regulator